MFWLPSFTRSYLVTWNEPAPEQVGSPVWFADAAAAYDFLPAAQCDPHAGGELRRILERVSLGISSAGTPREETVAERLAPLFASGELRMFEPEQPRPGAEPSDNLGSSGSLGARARVPAPRQERRRGQALHAGGFTWFEVHVVDEIGEALSGVIVTFDVGDRHQVVTGPSGIARVNGVRRERGAAELRDRDALRDEVRPRWDGIREEPWLASAVDRTLVTVYEEERIQASVLSETPHTIVIQPWCIRLRLLGTCFDTNKSFLLPPATENVPRIKAICERHPRAALLAIGHADTTGDPAINDPLSQERASSLVIPVVRRGRLASLVRSRPTLGEALGPTRG